eukprot:scaffold48096_cov33-Tisochrysis_lutea.AAC.10
MQVQMPQGNSRVACFFHSHHTGAICRCDGFIEFGRHREPLSGSCGQPRLECACMCKKIARIAPAVDLKQSAQPGDGGLLSPGCVWLEWRSRCGAKLP